MILKKIIMLVIYIGLGFIILMVVTRLLLPRFVFFPSSKIEATPADINLYFEDVSLTTEDNIKIHGWYVPALDSNDRQEVLLFFHGNGGNISHRLSSIKIFNDLGLSVFILSYRGYGLSEGKPSIDGTRLDALAAWRYLTEDRQIPAGDIVVFGRSLGGAVAMELMKSVKPGALILESTFSSLADMAPFPAFIAPLLMGGNYWNSAETAASLSLPTLVIHSPDDDVIPYSQGRRIYEAISSKETFAEKTFLEIQGDHNSGFMQSFNIYFPALESFLKYKKSDE